MHQGITLNFLNELFDYSEFLLKVAYHLKYQITVFDGLRS